jgi:predicted ATPase
MFEIARDDPPEVIHQKVHEGVRRSGGSEEAAALCSVAFERVIAARVLHEAPDFPAEAIREDIYEVVYPAWHEYATRNPALLVMDDLHWADQASIDLLMHLFGLVEEVPVVLLCAFRPERQSPAWQVKLRAETYFPHRYTEIQLEPLTVDQSERLVSALLDIEALPAGVGDLILRKAEGNPYFVEEVVRSLVDQEAVQPTEGGLRWNPDADVRDISIPDTLQALLMARMDRLDRETRSTLQLASVIGRSFYHRVLRAISDSTIELDRHLVSLERVELVREAVRTPELEYIFKHELARDAAYNSILHRRRRQLHRRVGEAMEQIFHDRLDENAHRLAQHFAAAGDAERALRYHLMAAEAAAALSANVEAAGHYARALEAASGLDLPEAEVSRLRERQASLVSLAGGARDG